MFAVSKEFGARVVLQLGGGRVHAAHAVFRGHIQTGMSGPRDIEPVHEEAGENHRQSVVGLRGHSSKRIRRQRTRRANRECRAKRAAKGGSEGVADLYTRGESATFPGRPRGLCRFHGSFYFY